MMEMPPPVPWAVEMGMPARHRDSMSLWMVRRDTSNCSASSGAVTFSRWSRMDNMPMSRSIFMSRTAFLDFCLYYSTESGQLSVMFLRELQRFI